MWVVYGTCLSLFLWQHMPVTGKKLKMSQRAKSLFNAWAADVAINRYLDWVSGEMKTRYSYKPKDLPFWRLHNANGQRHSDRSRSRT